MSVRRLPVQAAAPSQRLGRIDHASDDKSGSPGDVKMPIAEAMQLVPRVADGNAIAQLPRVIDRPEIRTKGTLRAGRFRLRPDYETLARDLLLISEAAIILFAAYACNMLFGRYGSLDWHGTADASLVGLAMIAAALSPVMLRGGQVKQPPDSMLSPLRMVGLALRVALLFALLAMLGVLAGLGAELPVTFRVAWAILSLFGLLLGRTLFATHLRVLRRNGLLRERVGIVWSGEEPSLAEKYLRGAIGPGLEVVGIFQDSGDGHTNRATIDDLVELAIQLPIDRVVVVTEQITSDRLEAIMRRLKGLDVDVTLWVAGAAHSNAGIAGSAGLPLIKRPIREWGRVIKAAEDILIALLVLPPALLVMAVIAIAIRVDTRGPVLFRQFRHGWNNSEFQVLKFRTMEWWGTLDGTGAQQTRRNDTRITRVGRFLRRTSLDELPQLFNVLRGEMSLVGPRPHPVAMRTEDRLGHEITPEYSHRHRVKPGLTGLAQINGCRGATETAEQMRRRVAYDNSYIESWSMLLDLKILALTPLRVVLHGGNAF